MYTELRATSEWLVETGDTAEVIRSTDWSSTPLGPREGWTPGLRTVLSLVLANGFPTVLLWGREFRLLFNDAFRAIAPERHATAIGRPAREVWPEVWHLEEPILAAVMDRGKTVYLEDVRFPIDREGRLEDAYFTLCYSPVRDEGAVAGTLVTLLETTGRVREHHALEAEREEAIDALRDSEERYRTVAENTPEVIARYDRSYRHTYINRYGATLYGLAAREIIGKSNKELGLAVDWERHFEQVFAAGRQISVDFELESPSFGHQYLSALLVPERDHTGEVASILAITRDVTAARRAEDALRDADRRKDEFIATLAHELRNPLAPVRFALRLMDGADPAAVERNRQVIDRQVNQMVRLVDDLLDVSRIAQNKIRLRQERVRLGALVGAAVESTEPHIKAAGHTFTVNVADADAEIDADAARLVQVFTNLLNNAAKFTAPGGEVAIDAAAADGWATVTVRDTGIGIPGDMLSRIFDLFHQAGNALDRSVGGLGLGLTIAKQLVEMHGGTLSVSSEGAGRGAEFRVALPLAGASARPAPAERLNPVGAGRHHMRVLVVDDNVDSAEMLSVMVGMDGYETRVAHDGESAIAAFAAFRPDVVLLDIGLPRINGYEVARRLRAVYGDRCYLVAITGWGQEEDRRRARAAGFDCHLTKPADPDVLRRLLEAFSSGKDCAGCSRCLHSPLTRSGDFARGAS